VSGPDTGGKPALDQCLGNAKKSPFFIFVIRVTDRDRLKCPVSVSRIERAEAMPCDVGADSYLNTRPADADIRSSLPSCRNMEEAVSHCPMSERFGTSA